MVSSTHVVPTGRLYIAGTDGGSSVIPPAHNYIAQKLSKSWEMSFLRRETPEAVMDVFRRSDFAGAVVTMPHKKTIIPYLDTVDELVSAIGACNVVSVTTDRRLHGTNVDWIAIADALCSAFSGPHEGCAMIYGAGGASRAAVYALAVRLNYREIYIINRDDEEIQELEKDVQSLESSIRPTLIPVRTINQSMGLPVPSCIIGTVPDIAPKTASEIEAKEILADFLSRRHGRKGVFLEMCYHPRMTSNTNLAVRYDWKVVDGVELVARQIKLHWKIWTGEEISDQCEKEALDVLLQTVEDDPLITPGENLLKTG